jgi:hypothetical protein
MSGSPLRIAVLICLLVAFPTTAAPVPMPEVPAKPIEEPTRQLDRLFVKLWEDSKARPAERTSDEEFLRRAMLDLVGRQATVEEVRAYLGDKVGDRRTRLVDRLLASKEFAVHWGDVLTDQLLPHRVEPALRRALSGWLADRLDRNTSYKEITAQLLTATGTPKENGAAAFTLALLGPALPKKDWADLGQFESIALTDQIGRVFLGADLHCIRCHDHPYTADRKQKHFWGVNAFLRQIGRDGDGAETCKLRDDPALNKGGVVFMEKRNGVVLGMKATFLDGKGLAQVGKGTRREALAALVVAWPDFPRVTVNRTWTKLFGRSFLQSPSAEDFGEHNPVVHPEVLDYLSTTFAASGYDLKRLLRWICTSNLYQLRSVGGTPSPDEPLFTRMALRPLTAQQRLRSLLVALRADDTLTAVQRGRLETGWLACFPRPDGDCEAHLVCCTGGVNLGAVPITTAESLHFLLGSEEVQRALAHDKGTVARALAQKKPEAVLDELYLAACNRRPTAAEVKRLTGDLAGLADKQQADFWRDLFFALLCGSEFTHNR